MVRFIAGLFGINTLWVWGAVFAAMIGASGVHVYNKGSARKAEVDAAVATERGLWQAAADEERARQKGVNDAAIQAAMADVQRLIAEKSELARLLKENTDEARNDKGAGRPALSPDSVLRLNRIR